MRVSEPRLWLPLIGVVLVVLMWSGNTIVSKVIMREASPVLVSLVRFTVLGLLFYLPLFVILLRRAEPLDRDDWGRLLLMGLAGTTGSQVLFMLGLLTTPATEAGIYQIVTPIFVVLIAWLWLGEHLGRAQIVGIVIAAVGATLLLTGGGATGLGSGDLFGGFLIITSNFVWAIYTVVSKRATARHSPLLVLAGANVVTMIAIWPLAGLLGVWAEIPTIAHWSPSAWAVLIYLIFLTGTTSQWLYAWTIREIGPSRVSAALYLKPLFVTLLAIAFLDEAPTLLTVVSGLLTLAGVWLVNRPRRPQVAAVADRRRPAVSPSST